MDEPNPNPPNAYERCGTTPDELIRIVEDIAKQLVDKFTFGPFEYRDIKQQCYLEALKAINRTTGKCYDKSRPLKDFLFIHIKNRLHNFERDNSYRGHNPCKTCPFYDKMFKGSDNQCLKFTQRLECELYANHRRWNDAKMSLYGAADQVDRPEACQEGEPIIEELCRQELLDLIDRELPADIRPDFLRLLANVRVSNKRRSIVRAAIRDIIQGSGQFPELDWFFLED